MLIKKLHQCSMNCSPGQNELTNVCTKPLMKASEYNNWTEILSRFCLIITSQSNCFDCSLISKGNVSVNYYASDITSSQEQEDLPLTKCSHRDWFIHLILVVKRDLAWCGCVREWWMFVPSNSLQTGQVWVSLTFNILLPVGPDKR